ncbi:MAG TPA: 16S rRNA (cytidine(1402)-2'-O)-methyltransferase [Ignavibacteria bacterium]|nr:16S rRNA (cytidine(1402)-2'-O)-methyltransferase [Ignavibacteria bacterium]
MSGTLNIVTTPIGNYSDITVRALRILNESDYIICEEYKEASKLLRFFDLKKDLVSVNEHNEKESSDEIFMDIVSGKNVSLISDCGTPLFSDPGSLLVQKCIEAKIKIEFIGGSNSLLASIVLSGFDISRFYFIGFLSPKSDIRIIELEKLKHLDKVIALMDAPYRLKAVLNDIKKIFEERKIFVAFNITMNEEIKFRGSAGEILVEIGENNLKGEFVIIIDKYNIKSK